MPRFIGIVAAILCSFTYVVAQIYGVGMITARLTGVAFEIGIFVGLGGILVCSFLGGMRAVTWTQVAQYIILIIAYMVPVVWLSVKQTSVPDAAGDLRLAAREGHGQGEAADRTTRRRTKSSRSSRSVADALAAKLKDVPAALAADKAAAEKKLADLKAANAPASEIQAAEKAVAAMPKDEAAAKEAWTAAKAATPAPRQALAGMPRHAQHVRRRPERRRGGARRRSTTSRRNFLALIFCLMVGTAALPHILMRYYTTPSGEGSAGVGDLVAVLHLPAVLHRAGAGGAGEVRDVQRAGRNARSTSCRSGSPPGTRSTPRCCRSLTSTRTASCSSAR